MMHAAAVDLIVFFPVRDLAATRDFYGRDLGLGPAREQPGCLLFRAPGGGWVGFCQHESDDALPHHEGLVLALVTPDVDAAYQRLRRFGVETEARPMRDERSGIYRFFARDPDGYRVAVQWFDRPLEGPEAD